MNPILKNILAVIAGLVFGSVINMSIVELGNFIIPPPGDVDSIEGLKATLPLFETKHFLTPFLAHTIGTFTGAMLTAFIAASRKMQLALFIGVFFLAGGVTAVFLLPSPTWFTITDLVLAYIPMAYLGGKLTAQKK